MTQETMNTQNETRVNEQEYSDIKVSKKTAKILDALRKWGILFDSLVEVEEFEGVEGAFQAEFYSQLDDIRDRLNDKLLSSISH